MGEDPLGELPRDPVARGCASGVYDPPLRVASLEAESLVELDAEVDEIADPGRRLLGQHGDGTRT